MKQRPYRIEYTARAIDNLAEISARERAIVVNNVAVKLCHEPQVETRNRKLLRANNVAPYELRLGELRVYYEVRKGQVLIKAVGVKDRGVVRIGRVEVKL